MDKWFQVIEARVTFDEFERLPRHPDYKQEYYDGTMWLTPRPRFYRAMLDLPLRAAGDDADVLERVRVRRLEANDWEALPLLFADAFWRVAPFGSLDDDTREQAGRECLERTRTGGDGPLVAAACCVASHDEPGLLGAILVTLVPDREGTEFGDWRWHEPPPADCLERRAGLPHLTWVFVHAGHGNRGIGTALLAAAASELTALGFRRVGSSFLSGNDTSLLWHWRNGFRLLPNPASARRFLRVLQRSR